MVQLFLRFLIGGAVVSAFAALGDILRPKSFAGLFGAAPSVALATLGLTIADRGSAFAGVEGRSMIAGAIGLFAYTSFVSWIMMRNKFKTLWVTICSIPLWFAVAFSIFHIWLE